MNKTTTGLVYLDYCATTPVDPDVAEIVMRHMVSEFGNAGSRTHELGAQAKRAVENARRQVSEALGVQPNEVVFTSGATESNNLAILGLAEHGIRSGRTHIVTTAIEHKSVLEPCAQLESRGFTVTYIRPNKSGSIDPVEVLAATNNKTLLVSVQHANNETGVINPIETIIHGAHKAGSLVHIDAAQSFCKVPGVVSLNDADLLSISGHKIGAPKGIGALRINHRREVHRLIKPILFGGGQEFGVRPGTVAVPLVAGFGMAAQIGSNEIVRRYEACLKTKYAIMNFIKNLGFSIIGSGPSLPNCISVCFYPIDAEAIFVALKSSHCVSNGSACTSASRSRSHVLGAMGLYEDLIDCSIRLSWQESTRLEDIESAIDLISKLR
ncbi:MAG: cysteine desulfurase family protein [Candidatus Krumholzibacteriia bacterium]